MINDPVQQRDPDNNTLHTEPRAARLLETMIFAAARRTLPLSRLYFFWGGEFFEFLGGKTREEAALDSGGILRKAEAQYNALIPVLVFAK